MNTLKPLKAVLKYFRINSICMTTVIAKLKLNSTQWQLKLLSLATAFKDFKVFTGLWLHHLTTFTGGWVGDLSETGNKAITASIDIEVELS